MQTNTVASTPTKPPSLTPAELPAESLKDSIAQVVTELTGQSVTTASVNELKLSEDVLYASVVHQRIETKYPGMGKKLLDAVGDEYGQNVKNQRRQPLKIAIDHFLHGMVRGRQITNNSKEALMQYALGKSQLDKNKTTLARVPENPTNALPVQTGKSSVDMAIERVNSNSGASKKEAAFFKERLAKNRKLTDAQAREQADVLSRMFPAKKAETPVAATPTGTPPPVAAGPSETDKPGPIPDPTRIVTGPNDFAYKPQSELDGKLVFIIPQRHRETMISASIFALDGKTKLLDLHPPRYGDDNRPYFRGDKIGTEFTGGAILRTTFVDGAQLDYDIPDLQKGHVIKY